MSASSRRRVAPSGEEEEFEEGVEEEVYVCDAVVELLRSTLVLASYSRCRCMKREYREKEEEERGEGEMERKED